VSTNVSELRFSLLESMMAFREGFRKEREARIVAAKGNLSFGVSFLDDAFGGIYTNDLIVLGAKTGIGKTHLATVIARKNAANGKRVHFFALEAEQYEIERRIKYQILADSFYGLLKDKYPWIKLNYMDWYYGKFESEFGLIEKEIEETFQDIYPELKTIYRGTGDYTIDDFGKQFLAIQDQTDLVIIDHLHYFDSDNENENRAVKQIVKKIRDLALMAGRPVILIAHLRKKEKRSRELIPTIEDFHGSSDIGKIATKALIVAPYRTDSFIKNEWPTFMRIEKCRTDMSRTRYIGVTGFDTRTNQYADRYYLGWLTNFDEEYRQIENANDLPYWAKHAKTNMVNTGV